MSGSDDQEVINIRPVAGRNSLTTLILGVALLFVAVALMLYLPDSVTLIAIGLLATAIVLLVLGSVKWLEPQFSMRLTRQHIDYIHRKGCWQLDWQNIQRIDLPRVQRGMQSIELPMIGLRVKDYSPFFETVSVRLAAHLLLEQRALLMHVVTENCDEGDCYSKNLIEDDKFKLETGKMLQGVQAMLANRMRRLREGLGYDLFISSTELDRSSSDFIQLLRQCHQAAGQVTLESQD
jgi:hypothetical protein